MNVSPEVHNVSLVRAGITPSQDASEVGNLLAARLLADGKLGEGRIAQGEAALPRNNLRLIENPTNQAQRFRLAWAKAEHANAEREVLQARARLDRALEEAERAPTYAVTPRDVDLACSRARWACRDLAGVPATTRAQVRIKRLVIGKARMRYDEFREPIEADEARLGIVRKLKAKDTRS